ncbi:hypothetical protein P7C70_g912, partial [Phenoliferia sp. Uapishka_3]
MPFPSSHSWLDYDFSDPLHQYKPCRVLRQEVSDATERLLKSLRSDDPPSEATEMDLILLQDLARALATRIGASNIVVQRAKLTVKTVKRWLDNDGRAKAKRRSEKRYGVVWEGIPELRDIPTPTARSPPPTAKVLDLATRVPRLPIPTYQPPSTPTIPPHDTPWTTNPPPLPCSPRRFSKPLRRSKTQVSKPSSMSRTDAKEEPVKATKRPIPSRPSPSSSPELSQVLRHRKHQRLLAAMKWAESSKTPSKTSEQSSPLETPLFASPRPKPSSGSSSEQLYLSPTSFNVVLSALGEGELCADEGDIYAIFQESSKPPSIDLPSAADGNRPGDPDIENLPASWAGPQSPPDWRQSYLFYSSPEAWKFPIETKAEEHGTGLRRIRIEFHHTGFGPKFYDETFSLSDTLMDVRLRIDDFVFMVGGEIQDFALLAPGSQIGGDNYDLTPLREHWIRGWNSRTVWCYEAAGK